MSMQRAGTDATGTPGHEEAGRSALVLALGSNLGDRLAHLQSGVDALDGAGITVTAVSGVFETTPVGGPAQDNYLNAVLTAQSTVTAREVLRRCAAAEAAAGRVRAVRWGPRTLDVDIITYGMQMSADAELTLPHPRAHERAFVLAPWLDVDPAAELPGCGSVAALLAATSMSGVWRRPDLRLELPPGREADPPCT